MARITPEHIKQQIVGEQFYLFPGTMMTVCCLTLRNGFNVVGTAACADPAIFDKEKGEEFALKDAESKVWQLEGYLLKQEIFRGYVLDHWPK